MTPSTLPDPQEEPREESATESHLPSAAPEPSYSPAVAETLLAGGVAPRGWASVGLADCYPTIVGDQDYLRAAYGMDAPAIVAAAHRALGRSA